MVVTGKRVDIIMRVLKNKTSPDRSLCSEKWILISMTFKAGLFKRLVLSIFIWMLKSIYDRVHYYHFVDNTPLHKQEVSSTNGNLYQAFRTVLSAEGLAP